MEKLLNVSSNLNAWITKNKEDKFLKQNTQNVSVQNALLKQFNNQLILIRRITEKSLTYDLKKKQYVDKGIVIKKKDALDIKNDAFKIAPKQTENKSKLLKPTNIGTGLSVAVLIALYGPQMWPFVKGMLSELIPDFIKEAANNVSTIAEKFFGFFKKGGEVEIFQQNITDGIDEINKIEDMLSKFNPFSKNNELNEGTQKITNSLEKTSDDLKAATDDSDTTKKIIEAQNIIDEASKDVEDDAKDKTAKPTPQKVSAKPTEPDDAKSTPTPALETTPATKETKPTPVQATSEPIPETKPTAQATSETTPKMSEEAKKKRIEELNTRMAKKRVLTEIGIKEIQERYGDSEEGKQRIIKAQETLKWIEDSTAKAIKNLEEDGKQAIPETKPAVAASTSNVSNPAPAAAPVTTEKQQDTSIVNNSIQASMDNSANKTQTSSAKKITSPFGFRNHPIRGEKQFHPGIDIGAGQGVPISVTVPVKVINLRSDPKGYGNYFNVTFPDGTLGRFAHMLEINVKAGEMVPAGTVVGLMGGAKGTPGAGTSTGPHLHFEHRHKMTFGGDPNDSIDPLQGAINYIAIGKEIMDQSNALATSKKQPVTNNLVVSINNSQTTGLQR